MRENWKIIASTLDKVVISVRCAFIIINITFYTTLPLDQWASLLLSGTAFHSIVVLRSGRPTIIIEID